MPDALVEKILHVWTPRFLRVGILMEDLNEIAARIETWDDWARAWIDTARVHEELGEKWLGLGDDIAAVEALQRASIYYHVAAFVYFRDPDLHEHGYRKMVETYDRSLPLTKGAIEKVRFPFEDIELVGLLSKPAGVARPPVVILIPGLDSSKEGRHSGRGGHLARGLAVLSIDGPGQGEMSLTTHIRPDYEAAIGAAIDFLETRDDVDASRVGIVGSSLGGYYAPRAAAYEKRVRACVAVSGPFRWASRGKQMMPVTREAYLNYLGAADDAELEELGSRLTLEEAASQITCPLLIIAGKQDPLVGWENAELLRDAASGPTELHVFDEGNHSCQNIPHKVMPLQHIFLAKHLHEGTPR
ncbi:MAG TPA: alpha/beta fold hydrolase [Nocardioides sp.]|nr:alpha/beta fold hydrolase [Nocardioides sp.]